MECGRRWTPPPGTGRPGAAVFYRAVADEPTAHASRRQQGFRTPPLQGWLEQAEPRTEPRTPAETPQRHPTRARGVRGPLGAEDV
jgi:hypothetical protein